MVPDLIGTEEYELGHERYCHAPGLACRAENDACVHRIELALSTA